MKVHAFEIPKSINDCILVQTDRTKLFYQYLHQHNEIQISYIINGFGKLIIGDSVHGFKPGDIFVVGGSTAHLFQSSEAVESSEMISIFFTKESFGNDFLKIPEMDEMQLFLKLTTSSFKLKSPNEVIIKIIKKLPNKAGLDKFICFLNLIKNINKVSTIPLTNFIQAKKITQEEGRRMRLVFDFVMNNFQTEIKLDKVAALIYMTPNAFCRFFKQRTNKTFFEFVIELRIEHACQLALNPENYTIADIAENSGFTSISNFNRKFKKLKGLTPTEYKNS